jgi:hypothetical protein
MNGTHIADGAQNGCDVDLVRITVVMVLNVDVDIPPGKVDIPMVSRNTMGSDRW